MRLRRTCSIHSKCEMVDLFTWLESLGIAISTWQMVDQRQVRPHKIKAIADLYLASISEGRDTATMRSLTRLQHCMPELCPTTTYASAASACIVFTCCMQSAAFIARRASCVMRMSPDMRFSRCPSWDDAVAHDDAMTGASPCLQQETDILPTTRPYPSLSTFKIPQLLHHERWLLERSTKTYCQSQTTILAMGRLLPRQ